MVNPKPFFFLLELRWKKEDRTICVFNGDSEDHKFNSSFVFLTETVRTTGGGRQKVSVL